MSTTASTKFSALDPLNLDLGYSDDELAVRDSVRGFLADQVTPYIADWFEAVSYTHLTLPTIYSV